MRPDFGDLAPVRHHNSIGRFRGLQAVRDEDRQAGTSAWSERGSIRQWFDVCLGFGWRLASPRCEQYGREDVAGGILEVAHGFVELCLCDALGRHKRLA